MDSYQWSELTLGMALQPKGWVLTRDLNARTAGAQWLAMDPTSGTEVLLYFPPLAVVNDDVLFDEWQRRSSRLVSKSEPLFQQVEEVVTTGVKWPFAVIEAVDGLDLNHFRLSLENRTIPISQLKGWLEAVSVALDRAHAEKQFHGRLTPESLVLNRSGEIRMLHHGWLALFSDLEQRAAGKLNSLVPPPKQIFRSHSQALPTRRWRKSVRMAAEPNGFSSMSGEIQKRRLSQSSVHSTRGSKHWS